MKLPKHAKYSSEAPRKPKVPSPERVIDMGVPVSTKTSVPVCTKPSSVQDNVEVPESQPSERIATTPARDDVQENNPDNMQQEQILFQESDNEEGGPPFRQEFVMPAHSPDSFNVHASDTDGYDSDLLNQGPTPNPSPEKSQAQNRVDFKKLTFFDGKGPAAPEVNSDFAEILVTNWWDVDKAVADQKDQLEELFKKYNPPENCSIDPPTVNTPIKALLTRQGGACSWYNTL